MDTSLIDNPDTVEHVLDWLCGVACHLTPIHSLQQIQRSGHVMSVLHCIDDSFKYGQDETCDLTRFMSLIEKYLEQHKGKVIKRRLRVLLVGQRPHLLLFCCLLLYLSVHCPTKEKFIRDILQKTPESQTCLMRVIEFIDHNVEDQLQMREILIKVEEIEMENDSLKEQLKHEMKKNNDLAERLQLIMADYKSLEDECDAYKAEKAEVFRELSINALGEYLALYRAVQNENGQLQSNIDKMDRKLTEVSTEKMNYKAKIMEDGQLITELNDEILRLKDICRGLRLSSSLSTIDGDLSGLRQNLSASVDCKILKENTLVYNRQSLSLSQTQKWSRIQEETCDESTVLQLRHQYKEMQSKYDKMCDICENQKEALENYEGSTQRLRGHNDFLRGKLAELREIHTGMTRVLATSSSVTPRPSYRC